MTFAKKVCYFTIASCLPRQVIRRAAIGGEHITVERDGYPVVVIVPLGDYRHLVDNQRPTPHQSAAQDTE